MKYDHDKVIENATTLFWKRGFHAAGMRDIQQALDMRPGSIYARFQSKEGLFKLVVERYAENSQAKLKAVANESSPLAALRAFFENALISPNEQRYMRQCLLVKSIAELDVIGDIAKKAVIDSMEKVKGCFIDVVNAAIEAQELPESTPVTLAADWLQNQFVGMRAFALLQDEEAPIQTMIDKVLLDIKGQWPADTTH
ncbi:TetR family transcriptional regulator [Alteromonas australica]|uniref:TetR/AcrR family transcriptional regulator n=1 Tax=Alteromonas australica TaxID=589873 RepID=A0A353JPW5_9ALTE|nr:MULTISPECIES: TetR/AcrR family transcriptional regulator [Alteromonas]MAF71612.1 TetR/AcrR family transcriptional regulator [Alteromonas sp.]AJP43570.1 TetR family transcriptional regulator [Alteromonas australica]MBU34261.1 TetR/AcrR family transcriptional regulator [Alteromonas sp.]QPL48627.1 TetR/AcrR family transcriptional regulator [Alteromonas sp. B31-7]HAI71711.1 TetR/AcrR family transcriptional regulator [Alteromonas australica]|tara:strand:+ start:2587 stop:3180 length:594 start_codon:yes stop_codon:yes gene_type:complete